MPEQIDSVPRALGRIEQKLDNALGTQEQLKAEIDTVEERTTSLESSRTYYKGALAVITAIVVWVASHLNIPPLP